MILYAHNENTYIEACDKLFTNNKCAIIQATGTGKSYITMMFLDSVFKGLRVIYAVPTMAIAESIQMYDEWHFDNVEFVTYSSIDKVEGHIDLLILDELHRAGARTWFINIQKKMLQASYVIGLSATPLRFLDGRRDMAQELFGDSVVYGPDITKAISDGILPSFDYVAILSESRIEYEYNKLSWQDKIKVSGLRLDEYNLGERIKKYIKPEHKKIIIFYADSQGLEQSDPDIENWLGDVKVFSVYSKQTRAENKRNLREFNLCSERCVLRAVDMLNEGVHISGVNVAIFARRTVSGNVYMQQIGRVLSASKKKVHPVIIDLVENYRNIKILDTVFKDSKVKVTKTRGSKISIHKDTSNATEVLISYDDVLLELEDVLAKVKNVWTDEEDAILKKYYEREGKKCFIRIKDKTDKECSKRVRLLGLTANRYWTEEEDGILRKYYRVNKEDVWRLIPGRTQASIDRRADKLGLIDKWTAEEDLLLMRNWEDKGLSMHPMLPRHGFKEIIERAKRLGLQGPED